MDEIKSNCKAQEESKFKNDYYIEMKWRYELVIKARNFHYENFNKWMTYFYVMIGALFLGVCYIISKSEKNTEYTHALLFVIGIGFIVSLFWYWASKGYYYWNINFITLVNHYEKNILKFEEDERVYMVFANKSNSNYLNPTGGANISTSKLSILLSFIISCFWGIAFLNLTLDEYIKDNKAILYCISTICTLFFISSLSEVVAKRLLSSYHKHFPDLQIKTGTDNFYRPVDEITT